MKYNVNWLIQKYDTEEWIKFLFFWGHKPNQDGSIGKTCFSQWFDRGFTVDEIEYKTAEHWMMAGKARLFEDTEMLEKILVSKTPGEAKKLGRKVRNFDGEVWEQHRTEIVVQGNIHKFEQNEDLKTFLMNTNSRVLVEASPRDRIWGIGLGQNNVNANNPHQWRGLNLLGFALMEVRDRLS